MNIRELFGSIIKIVYPRMVHVTINGEQARAVRSMTIENDPEDNIELKDISIPGFTNHAHRGEQRRERRERRRDLAKLLDDWERSCEADVFSLRRLFRCEVDFAPATEERPAVWEELEADAEHRTFWEEEAARYRRRRRADVKRGLGFDEEDVNFWEEEAARARREWLADAERRLRLRLEEEGKHFWEEEAARDRRGADAERRLGLRLEEEVENFWEEEESRALRERQADADYRRSLGLDEEVEIIVVEDEEAEIIAVEDDDPLTEDMDWAPEEDEG